MCMFSTVALCIRWCTYMYSHSEDTQSMLKSVSTGYTCIITQCVMFVLCITGKFEVPYMS